MSAHTPGPWMAEASILAPRTGALVGVYVAQQRSDGTPDGRVCECFGNCLVTTDEALAANARLIAAAPDLLDVARRVAEYFADTDAPLGIAARAAIAKAEGSANV